MQKRNINTNPKQITDAEILKHKNFDKVLQAHQSIPFFKKPLFWGAIGVASIALIVVFNLTNEVKLKADENVAQKEVQNENKQDVFASASEVDTFYVDENGGEFVTYYGTVINVPKNAFSKDNKKVKGKVMITFQDYHDASDIIANDINMKYDSAGVSYQLETAGMIDLYAFQNGEAVDIAKNKFIDIQIAGPTAEDDFNFYTYNFDSKKWKYEHSDVTVVTQNQTSKKDVVIDQSQLIAQKDKCQKTIVNLQENKPMKPVTEKETPFTFSLDIEKDAFPELAGFDGLKLGAHPTVSSDKQMLLKKVWNSMELESIEKGLLYRLNLTSNSLKESFLVVPIGKSSEWDKQFNKYQNWETNLTTAKNELEEIEAQIKKEKKEILELEATRNEINQNHLNQGYEKLHEKKEKPQDLTSWRKIRIQLDAERSKKIVDSKTAQNNLMAFNTFYRSVQMRSTGRCNLDRAVPFPDQRVVEADFVAYDDKYSQNIVRFKRVFLIDEKKNTTYEYAFPDFQRFGFNPKNENILIAFSESGQAYFLAPEKFEMMNNKKERNLIKLEPCKKDISSSEAMRLFVSELFSS